MVKHRLWAFLIALSLALGVGSGLTACGLGDDDATAAPAAFTSPVDGKQYCAWMNNPHECDQSGLPAAPFAMPQSQPVREPGMSNMDYALLGGLFGYYMGHHSYYNRPWYYDNYIGPAWTRYPSGNYYAYPGHPVTRITTVNNYTTIVHNVDTKYATQEKSFSSNPKYSTYKTANGKTYTGTTVPSKAFSGTNVPVNKKPLGGATYGNSNSQTVKNPSSPVKPSTSTNTGSSKSGYGKSYSGSSGSWFGGSSSKSYGGYSGSFSKSGRR
jgi:hypothetical protein